MIKFRAWIKTGIETYDYVKPMTIQQMIHSKESTFSLKRLNDLVDFEQFTGLTDVNGNDVYEGDIVEVYRQGIDEVVFANGSFGLIPNQYHQFEPLSELDGGIKKIGNVHTNQELLEE